MIWMITFLGAFAYFSFKRMLTYIHIFQQEEYDNVRFLKWILRHHVVDVIATSLILSAIILLYYVGADSFVMYISFTAILLGVSLHEKDPRRAAKKKLAITDRVKRILIIALLFSVVLSISVTYLSLSTWCALALIHIQPILLIVSNCLLMPIEFRIQKKYWNKASQRLHNLSPYVIGITGSYGKTSVKHILGHVLDCFSPTLITPGSINTAMGISRIIRTKLESKHKYFVVEMGAYGIGSIARLCKLTPPQLAIVTNIGSAHLERFKSLNTVARAKYELAEFVLKTGGNIITQEDVLSFEPFSSLVRDFKETTIICGFCSGDMQLENIKQNLGGIAIDMKHGESRHSFEVPLFGLHHAMNAAIAYAAAHSLGFSSADIINALTSVPQIPHRLEVKQFSPGVILIDDAYNSNPIGFRSAVELLHVLANGRGRRILVTPGLVELGQSHIEEHARLGAFSADYVDILIAVCPNRITSFVEAYQVNGTNAKEVVLCHSFTEAEIWIRTNVRHGDVVLLENDLPDIYESKLFL